MIELICENARTSDRINLTYNPYLKISNIEGLDPPKADITTITTPYMAGGRFQRSNVQERQIIITFYVTGNTTELKRTLFKVFKSGQKGILYINGELRSGKIEYYFEELQMAMFDFPVTMQIVLKAPYPYFEGLSEVIQELKNITNHFVFPFSIAEEGMAFGSYGVDGQSSTFINDGDVETGIEIQFIALGEVKNPSVYNVLTQESIGANITLEAGETLVIDTHTRNKSIRLISPDKTKKENQISNIMLGSTWLQVNAGTNEFGYDAEEGKLFCLVRFVYSNEYEEII